MFAAFGYCLVGIFHKKRAAICRRLSPLFLTLLAFCFSMTVGVFWEFIEYGGDILMGKDMQKDAILQEFHTIKVENKTDKENTGYVHTFEDIGRMELYDSEGNLMTSVNGYLDIGLTDTMKDMALNCLGAAGFCVLGYWGLRSTKGGRLASFFIPTQQIEDGDTPNKDGEHNAPAPIEQ